MLAYYKKETEAALARARSALRSGLAAVKNSLAFASSQLKDPAVHRAVLLGLAAYFIRQLPFLDQATAESLSDKGLVLAGLVLSKLPGTKEIERVSGELEAKAKATRGSLEEDLEDAQGEQDRAAPAAAPSHATADSAGMSGAPAAEPAEADVTSDSGDSAEEAPPAPPAPPAAARPRAGL